MTKRPFTSDSYFPLTHSRTPSLSSTHTVLWVLMLTQLFPTPNFTVAAFWTWNTSLQALTHLAPHSCLSSNADLLHLKEIFFSFPSSSLPQLHNFITLYFFLSQNLLQSEIIWVLDLLVCLPFLECKLQGVGTSSNSPLYPQHLKQWHLAVNP